MPFSIRMFLKLSELAKRWNKTEDELLHLAANGDLPLSAWYNGIFHQKFVDDNEYWYEHGHYRGFILLSRKDACELVLAADGVNLRGRFKAYEGKYIRLGSSSCPNVRLSRKAIVVLAKDVARMEEEYSELLFGGAPVGEVVNAEADKNDSPPLPTSKEVGGSQFREENVSNKVGGKPKGPLAEAVEKAYLQFHAAGNVEILKRGMSEISLKASGG